MVAYNNVIYNNNARIGAGIAMLDGAVATVQNNTIAHNYAAYDPDRPSGGGIFVRRHVENVEIFNNIITRNDDYQIFEEYSRAAINHNLLNDHYLGIYFNWDLGAVNNIEILNISGYINANDNISGSEAFVNPDQGDYRLTANSVARNRSGAPLLSLYDRDYFFRSATGLSDLGAFEYSLIQHKPEPVYRFWSDLYHKHFYTIDRQERNAVLHDYPLKTWKYEGVVFRAYHIDQSVGDKVHRFWSSSYNGHFYTINNEEKLHIIEHYPAHIWRYEGEAYGAEKSASATTTELYRFWSDTYRGHFYTADIVERDHVRNTFPEHIWKYEGVGYHVNPAD